MISRYLALSILAMSEGTVSCGSMTGKQMLEGRTISRLSFLYTGDKTVDEDRLRSRMKSQPGTKYAADKIDADIGVLFESGLVTDMHVDAESREESVRLIAVVTTPPPFGPTPFIGNTAFSDVALARQTGLRYATQLSKEDLKKAASSIEAFYSRSGYPNARVRVKSLKGGSPLANDFVFVINEGSRNTTATRPAKTAEQPGSAQPATQPAAKAPVKDQPSTLSLIHI